MKIATHCVILKCKYFIHWHRGC